MIIATIANRKFKLKNLAAAEQLLKIMDETEILDDPWVGHKKIYFVEKNPSHEMSISFLPGEPITEEEYKKLKDAEEVKKQ